MLFCSISAHFSEIQLACDRPTDRRTDTPSYRDARTHLINDHFVLFCFFLRFFLFSSPSSSSIFFFIFSPLPPLFAFLPLLFHLLLPVLVLFFLFVLLFLLILFLLLLSSNFLSHFRFIPFILISFSVSSSVMEETKTSADFATG